jgi:hypothetical protein
VAGKPVVALDIDGTLGDFHGHFTRFAEQWSGRSMPSPEDMSPGVPFFRHLGMSKATYRQCKLAYRQGGLLRSMPVYPGAAEMTRDFRRAGAQVWLCTTRPYLKMDNTDADTRHWLRRNSIKCDGITYGPHKYRDLLQSVNREDVLAALDDLPEQCYAARQQGLQAYLKDAKYNSNNSDFPRVFDFTFDPWRDSILRFIAKRRANE